MTRISLLDTAHGIVRSHLKPGDLALDATLGNGYDTAFLAGCVAASGHVYGFDVQQQAIFNTRERLRNEGLLDRVSLFHACHAEMSGYIPKTAAGRIQAAMFNLGYLPGGDKSLITQAGSTLAALQAACALLSESGLMTVMAYPGHAGGDLEADALRRWCERLAEQESFHLAVFLSSGDQPKAPRLFVIRKQADLL